MSPIGPEGAGGARRRKGTPRKNPTNGKSPLSGGSKASRPAPFTKTTSGKTTSRSISIPSESDGTTSIAPKPETRISDLAWMKLCAMCQTRAIQSRTMATASAAGKIPFTVAHGVRQMPSGIASGAHTITKSTTTGVKKLQERVVKKEKGPKPRFQSKIRHQPYKPITENAARYPRGKQWIERMDYIEENVDPVIGRAVVVKDQVELGKTGTALDTVHAALLIYKETRALHHVAGDIVMGRLAQPKGIAEMWALSHRIKMNELRIAQITLQIAINELESRPQPLSAVDTRALQAAFRLMIKLEDKALATQSKFMRQGSLLGSDELFLLDLDGMSLDELNALAQGLNKENNELQEYLPLQEAWVEAYKEEAEIEAPIERLGYVDTIITGLRLPNVLADFWKNNIHTGLSFINRISPTLHIFNYISLGLTAPLTVVSTGFSIYQWTAGERIIGKINQYLTRKETTPDDELHAIADQIKTSQDRWLNLFGSICSIIGTGTFFVNLGFIVIPTLIPAIAALATSIGAGIVFTGIAPWFVFVAGLVLLSATSGLLLYRIARHAQNQYRLRKCEFVVSQFDKLLGEESQYIPATEREQIEEDLSQLLGYKISNLSPEDKAALHHRFRLKLIKISPEYAIDRFLHRLMDQMESTDKTQSNDAFEFLESLEIFSERELAAITKSRQKGTAHQEVAHLLRKRLRM